MKLVRLLANLGYGSRREVQRLIRAGAITDDTGVVLRQSDVVPHDRIRCRGEALDPPSPLVIALNKPGDYTCSSEDPGRTIYVLLPPRFARRNPGLNPIGRLDKDTTGLLLMSDDGKLLHKIIHPKSGCSKTYQVHLDRALKGHEGELFAAGTLLLNSETRPLLPAGLEVLGEKEARITVREGRYHQVRRMFAAAGNHVLDLRRISIGGLQIPSDLEEGCWRVLDAEELKAIFV